ncbi:MAG: transglutaminase domain-containing protein [Clostridia bacterium]
MKQDMMAMQAPLPEDIQNMKGAGYFTQALAMIEARLEKEIPTMLRQRLRIEEEILRRLPQQYPYDQAAALEKIRERIPDFSEDAWDALLRAGKLDFICIEGKPRFFCRFFQSLRKTDPGIAALAGAPLSPENPLLDKVIGEMRQKGRLGYHIQLRASLRVNDAAFIPDETYRVHLPMPAQAAQQKHPALLASDPPCTFVSPETHLQRTVYFKQTLRENRPFTITYAYDNEVCYVNPLSPMEGACPYPDVPAPTEADVAEMGAHIRFTPYLRALAYEIVGEETVPARQARLIYDYITTHVQYAFMRQYFTLEHIAEAAAVNLKGDCGVQALLFITLCRIVGIPARWQSGLYVTPEYVGSHDWAQFYVAPYGWLFCDCSFGGSAYRVGNQVRWDFYFGNLDPYRMVANASFQADLTPEKRFFRADPYDNQEGECECSVRGFASAELDTECTLLAWQPFDPATGCVKG